MNRSGHLALVPAALFLCLALPFSTLAAGRAECRAMQSKILARPVRYCILLPPSYDTEKNRRYPVLYYLHGLRDNEQSLINFGGWNLVQDLEEHGRIGEFLIATPDGGGSFYINSRDGHQRYEDFFLREFIPLIERSYRTRSARAYRGITGASMGGYGALHLAFVHPELFGSVSAHSAALIENLPDARLPAGRQSVAVRILGEVFGSPPDHEFWARNSPLTLARQRPLGGLKIYFDCGTEDDYGFAAGAQTLHDRLQARKLAHEFHLYPGGHDWQYFAAHLEGSLSFHSRAFGLSPGKL